MFEMLKKNLQLVQRTSDTAQSPQNFRNKLEFQAAVYQLHEGRKKNARLLHLKNFFYFGRKQPTFREATTGLISLRDDV